MCQPEACPFAAVCKERVEIATYFRDERQKAIEIAAETTLQEIEAKAPEGIDQPTFIMGVRSAAVMLRDTLNNHRLTYEILAEEIQQHTETWECPGVTIERKHGFFGSVTARVCGSEARRSRLESADGRLEPPEGRSLLPTAEEDEGN